MKDPKLIEVERIVADHKRSMARVRPGPAGRQPPRTKPLNTRKLMETDPPPIEWLIPGVAAPGKLSMYVAREKAGKSLTVQAFALAAASGGGTVAGIEVAPARVLIFDAENGEEIIHQRLHTLDPPAGFDPDNLTYISTRGMDLPDDLEHLRAMIEEHEPDWFVIDTWRSHWSGDENDPAAAGACLYPISDLCREIDCAPAGTILHHTPHSADRYRGTTGIGAAIDSLIVLTKKDPDDERDKHRLLRTAWARFDPQVFPRRYFTLDYHDGGTAMAETAAWEDEPAIEDARALWDALGDGPPLGRTALIERVEFSEGKRSRRAFALAMELGWIEQPIPRGLYQRGPIDPDDPAPPPGPGI